jgi:radical SAM superfamily enzyme YgiQ (UPF0313 family)
MRSRRIHLINPEASSFTTRPMYFGRALYSPLAGLLAVAAVIPEDKWEVVLTDENVEPIDFDLDADLVGISAMTGYVRRGYEIAAGYRRRGIPVIMGGVHPSFMPREALEHADAVCVGEAELVVPKILDDVERGNLRGIYRADGLLQVENMKLPRYDLVKKQRYVNSTFIQTSRGCHHACTFCSEHLMNGLRFRYRPVDDVIREIESCGMRTISLNDADFFGTQQRPAELMRALKGRGIRWQAGVTSRLALRDDLLELAAESGCYTLSIGFESISKDTLKSVHKLVNQPDTFRALVDKVHSYGILVFGLFMFGFDGDDPSVFDKTVEFNIDADYDVCAYSALTPYPGTLTWYEMQEQGRIFSYDWNKYDQECIVYEPKRLTKEQLSDGRLGAYEKFYSVPSMLGRFPLRSSRSKPYWAIYNLFFRKGEVTGRDTENPIADPTPAPGHAPEPPIMPERADWQALVVKSLESHGSSGAPTPRPAASGPVW